MSKELPFSVFREVLRGARGKAVGAGGLSLEMLAEAGIDVQVEVYNALMDDVLQETLSPAMETGAVRTSGEAAAEQPRVHLRAA